MSLSGGLHRVEVVFGLIGKEVRQKGTGRKVSLRRYRRWPYMLSDYIKEELVMNHQGEKIMIAGFAGREKVAISSRRLFARLATCPTCGEGEVFHTFGRGSFTHSRQ